jgi:hypothetical protein
MKTLYLILAIAAIVSQIPHAYWSIERYNRINPIWLGRLQNVIFCGIISIGIFAFAYDGKHLYALAGAVVEIAINMYYYANQFKRLSNPVREHWLAYFLAVLIPITIYVFSYHYAVSI